MADPNVARFPAAAVPDIGTTVDNLLALLLNIETAEADLILERKKKRVEKIDAYTIASKPGVNPVDAVKAKLDFDAVRKTYDDQAAALDFWEHEAGQRLDELAGEYGDLVLAALEKRLTQLKQQQLIEQGDVDKVKNVISEFETRRQHLQALILKRQKKEERRA